MHLTLYIHQQHPAFVILPSDRCLTECEDAARQKLLPHLQVSCRHAITHFPQRTHRPSYHLGKNPMSTVNPFSNTEGAHSVPLINMHFHNTTIHLSCKTLTFPIASTLHYQPNRCPSFRRTAPTVRSKGELFSTSPRSFFRWNIVSRHQKSVVRPLSRGAHKRSTISMMEVTIRFLQIYDPA